MRASVYAGVLVLISLHLAGCGPGREWSTESAEAVRAYEEGVVHWNRFYYTEAEAAFKKSIAADSQFAVAWGRLGFLHLNTLDEAAARREGSRALALCANATLREQLLVRLWFYRINYDNTRAAAVADSLITLTPGDPEPYFVRGQLFEFEKNLEAAVRMYERAMQADTGFGLAVMSLGYAYSNLGEQDKAVGYMQRYITLAPGLADPKASYADVLLRAGRYEEALEQYNASLALKPDYWYSVRQIGAVFALMGRLKDAQRELDRSLGMMPSGTAATATRLRLHAYLDIRRGAFAEASRQCQEAIAADSSVLASSFTLAFALAKQRRFEEAWSVVAQALDELREKNLADSPTMQAYHLMRARVLTEEGKYDEAEQACKSALEYSTPLMREAVYSQLARTYAAASDFESALDAVEGALGVNPNDPDVLLVLTKIYKEQGDRHMAREVGGRLAAFWNKADDDFLPLIELRRLLGSQRTQPGT